jgi:IPT/TIG domain
VTAISPHGGPQAGGTSVLITGTGFTTATAVNFGDTPATNFSITDDSHITAVSPAGTATVDVKVANLYGPSGINTQDNFTYS